MPLSFKYYPQLYPQFVCIKQEIIMKKKLKKEVKKAEKKSKKGDKKDKKMKKADKDY